MNTLKLEMLSTRIEKTAILFELYKGLIDYFDKNPEEVVKISLEFKRNSPSDIHYITLKSSIDEGQSVVFSNIFHFLHKCVTIFDTTVSPFGQLALKLVACPQQLDLVFEKNNFLSVFDYSDDFEGKKEWLELIIESKPNSKYIDQYNRNLEWGEYPSMVFNEKTYNDWQKLKSTENYVKSKYSYYTFIKSTNVLKNCFESLTSNQYLSVDKSYITIFEDGKIIDCIELEDFKHIRGVIDKVSEEKSFNNFIENNAMMIDLNFNITESMLKKIFN